MSSSQRPACLLANAFGVGSSDWLDLPRTLVLAHFLSDVWISLHVFQAGSQSVNFRSVCRLIFYIQHIDCIREQAKCMDIIDGGTRNIFMMHLSVFEEQFRYENR